MALPALNNKNAIGNLSLDDKSQILTSLVQSGKLQLVNYGAINLNQNVTSNATATKENSSNYFGEAMVRALENIKGLLFDLNNNILRYIETTSTSQQVTQNLLESKAKDIEVTKTAGGIGIGKENLEKFYKIFESMNNGILKLSEGVGIGGTFGTGKGFLGSLLGSLLPKLLKGFLFGAAGAGIYKAIDWLDDREMNNSPWEKAKKFAKDTLGLEFEEEGENQEQRTAEQTGTGTTPTTGTQTETRSQQTSPGAGTTPTGRLVQVAEKFEGMTEKANKKELEAFFKTNLGSGFGISEAWCATFVNSVLSANGYKKSKSVKSAKSFLTYGEAVNLNDAKPGDIAVFNRGTDKNKGHVGFVVSLDGNMITIIGGNQGTKGGGGVTRSTRNTKKKNHELVAIRRPTEKESESAYKEPSLPQTPQTTPVQQNETPKLADDIKKKGVTAQQQNVPSEIEEEEEQEETSEKVQEDPSLKKETATKETATQSNEKKVFDFFVSKGFTKEQAAGITGSLKIESPTFNPNQKQKGGGPGRGIAQWSVDGPRFKELKARKGDKWNTLNGQLEYIYEEITGQTKHKEYGNVYKGIKSAKSAKEATEIWTKEYEKAGKENMTQRISAAEGILKKYSIGSTETELAQETPSTGDAAKPKGQQTDTEEQPKEKTLVDTLKDAFGSTLENITKPGNIKSVVDEGLYQGLSAIGEGFTFAGVEGFDNSRLRKLKKPEETIDEKIVRKATDSSRPEETIDEKIVRKATEFFRPEETIDEKIVRKATDSSRPEETIDEKIVRKATEFFRPEETANLQPNVKEELSGKRLEETTKNNESLKESKMEAIKAPQESQAPNINVNAPVSGGNGGGDDFAAGGISKMDVRDSVLHQMQYRKGSSSALV
jgi:uncharacterized protein (TIGR02594 family)